MAASKTVVATSGFVVVEDGRYLVVSVGDRFGSTDPVVKRHPGAFAPEAEPGEKRQR